MSQVNSNSFDEKDIDVGRSSLQVFGHLLQGLLRDRWSGKITVNADNWKKQIFLDHGRLSFASSSLMEDRLGEVMYRRGLLTLDQLTSSSVKVGEGIKFGQILLRDKIITNTGLWHALKIQTVDIVKSIFLNERVGYLIQRGESSTASFTIIDGSHELIDKFKVYNLIFLKFCSSITDKTALTVSQQKSDFITQGSFYGDLLALIKDNRNILEMISSSRLNKLYAMAAIMEISMLSVCSIDFDFSCSDNLKDKSMLPVKSAADKYKVVLEKVSAEFKNYGCDTAIDEICRFSRTLSHLELSILALDCDGEISDSSLARICDHCAMDPGQTLIYANKIETVTRFMLQMATDLLPAAVVQKIIGSNFHRELAAS